MPFSLPADFSIGEMLRLLGRIVVTAALFFGLILIIVQPFWQKWGAPRWQSWRYRRLARSRLQSLTDSIASALGFEVVLNPPQVRDMSMALFNSGILATSQVTVCSCYREHAAGGATFFGEYYAHPGFQRGLFMVRYPNVPLMPITLPALQFGPGSHLHDLRRELHGARLAIPNVGVEVRSRQIVCVLSPSDMAFGMESELPRNVLRFMELYTTSCAAPFSERK